MHAFCANRESYHVQLHFVLKASLPPLPSPPSPSFFLPPSLKSVRVKVVQNATSVERRFSSWIGGSILASLVSCNDMNPLLLLLYNVKIKDIPFFSGYIPADVGLQARVWREWKDYYRKEMSLTSFFLVPSQLSSHDSYIQFSLNDFVNYQYRNMLSVHGLQMLGICM